MNNIASYIDQSVLGANATKDKIENLCEEAARLHFAAVAVNSCWTAFCVERLKGTGVKVAPTVGFPLGQMDTAVKAYEAKHAVDNGAEELDMVINVGWLKDGMDDLVEKDICAVREACRGITMKVIIEACLLTDEEKVRACRLAVKAGADFVKTSTGFSTGGATVEDIALMRKTVGPDVGVKAAGGVRTYEDAMRMIEAGATRIGTSAGVAIVNGAPKN